MSKILKVALASATLIVGSSLAFAADRGGNDGRGHTPNGTNAGVTGNGRSTEQQDKMLLDTMPTGSITNCESQTYDQYGNCIVDEPYQR